MKGLDNSTGFPWNGSHDVGGFLHALWLCNSISPDVIHCHDSHAHNIGSLLRVLKNVPVIVTRRVVFPIRDTRFNRWRFHHVDHMIAISSAVARECQRMAPDVPITVAPDGVKWEEGERERDSMRADLGLKADQLVLGTVGFFTEEKNFKLILQTADHLRSQHPNAVLLCIGPLSLELQAQAQARPNILLTGRVPDAAGYYPAFDLYLSSSKQEGLGSSILDAVVRDIPVVAVDSIGSRDIFDSDSVLVASDSPQEFLQAVESAVTDLDQARAQAVERGKRARKEFSVRGMISRNINVYRGFTDKRCVTLANDERPDDR